MMPTTITLGLLSTAVIALTLALGAIARTLGRLHRALDESRQQIADLSLRLQAVERAAAAAARGPVSRERPTMTLRVDPPETSAIPSPMLIAVPNLATVGDRDGGPEAAESSDRLNERFGGLWELADSGASPTTIARATGVPVGRVELILGLRRRGGEPIGPEADDA